MVAVSEGEGAHIMPSFADIKSQALKAKDSATDKFNSTRDRYQVSISLPTPELDIHEVVRRSDTSFAT